jgi:hypothetical protein
MAPGTPGSGGEASSAKEKEMRSPWRFTPEEVDAMEEVSTTKTYIVGDPSVDWDSLKVDLSKHKRGDKIIVTHLAKMRANWRHPEDYLWYYDSAGRAWDIQEEEDGTFRKLWSAFANTWGGL